MMKGGKRILAIASLLLWGCASVPASSVPDLSATSDKPDIQASQFEAIEVRASKNLSDDLFQMIDTVALAVEARAKGETNEALDLFHKAWLADPANPQIIQEYSALALRLGNAQAALNAYKAIKVDFDTAPPALIANYVLAETTAGRAEDIELSLNLALEKNLDDPRLWSALGQYFDKQAKHLRAQDYYLKALETGGNKAGLINNIGMSLLLQGQREAALEKFIQAVELDRKNPLFDNNRRLVLALQSDYIAAAQGLPEQRAADILNDAGYIAQQRQEKELAAQLFERSIHISPRHHTKADANLKALSR
jgi:Flp pilus assembly protein TadD